MNQQTSPYGPLLSAIKPWIFLFGALLCLILFVVAIVPWISGMPGFKALVQSNQLRQIEADGLFYTENPTFSRSENYIRNLER